MRDCPEWFNTLLINNYINELHIIKRKAEQEHSAYDDKQFKNIAVEFFKNKGFIVWLDEKNQLWFDINENDSRWTFEILANSKV